LVSTALLIIFLVNLFLGTLVFWKNKRSSTNRYLSLFIFSAAGWALGIFALLTKQISNLNFLGKLTFGFATLIPSSLVLFSFVFPKPTRKLTHWGTFVIFAPALVLLASLSTNLLIGDIQIYDGQINPTRGPLYQIFVLYFIVFIIWFFVRLFLKYRIAEGKEKNQINYVFLGILLFAFFAMGTNLILPAFGINQLNSLGPIFSVLMVGSMSYAIIKHRLMDIRMVVAKSITYSFLIFLVGAFYAAVVFLMGANLGMAFPPRAAGEFILEVMLLSVIIFSFPYLRKFIEKATDKVFFKGRYDPQELLKKLGHIMTSSLEVKFLSESLLLTITKEMRVGKAALLLTSSPEVAEAKTIGYEEISIFSWRKIGELVGSGKTLVFDELGDGKAKDLLGSLDIAIVMPLHIKTEPIGYLVLGEKLSGDMYSAQDLKFLETLGPELAIALHNAKLFKLKEEKIQELNALNKLTLSVVSGVNLEELLKQMLEQALLVIDAETGSVMLIEEENNNLIIKTIRGLERQILERPQAGKIAKWVAENGEPLIIVDSEDGRFEGYLKRNDITSSVSVPLKIRDKVIGVLSLNRRTRDKIFTPENLELINSFASQAAVAIENARLRKDVIYLELIEEQNKKIKQQNQEISNEKKKVEAIVRNVASGIIVANSTGKAIYINPAAVNILKTSEILGKNLFSFLGLKREKIELIKRGFESLLKCESLESFVKEEIDFGGKIISVRINPFRTKEGKFSGAIAVLDDITREKEVDRMKTEFVYNISHEFRTPLASIKAYTETLLDNVDAEDQETQKEFLSTINVETDRLARMIKNVLDISKIEAGLVRFKKEAISMEELIEKTINFLSAKAKDKNVSLSHRTEGPLPGVVADGDAIKQVLINLTENAIKHTLSDGYVKVSAKIVDGDTKAAKDGWFIATDNKIINGPSIEIFITDNGEGIHSGALPKIFNKFYQAKICEGTGLGLYLVKQIVDAHKGLIMVKSEPGKGSAFGVRIPLKSS